MGFIIQEGSVREVISIGPGIAFSNEFPVDVSITQPDFTDESAVAIRITHPNGHILTEYLFRQRLSRSSFGGLQGGGGDNSIGPPPNNGLRLTIHRSGRSMRGTVWHPTWVFQPSSEALWLAAEARSVGRRE